MERVYTFKKLADLKADDVFATDIKHPKTQYWVILKKEGRIVIAKSGSIIKRFLDDEIVITNEDS